MKTTKQMLAALCSLVLLAGCVEPTTVASEEDEAPGEGMEEGVVEDEGEASAEQALGACVYPVDSGGGERTSATGCFMWGNTVVDYKSKGAVNNSGSMASFSTLAKPGDFEIVAFGASHGKDDTKEVDTYFDAAKMLGQKFQAIGVKGSLDKKVELWIRKNTGQATIKPPSKAKSYNLLVLDGLDVQLNLQTITRARVKSAGSTTWDVPSLSDATRLNVLAYYGDDSFEVVDSKGGEMIFNKWGFGDGDSLNVIFYQPYDAPPSKIDVKRYDKDGGSEYVGLRAHFRRL